MTILIPQDTDETAGFDSEDEAPDEISVFRAQLGIEGKFSCTLKKSFQAGGEKIMEIYKNVLPSIADIGKVYGPGAYKLICMYRTSNGPGGGKVPKAEELPFVLGEHPWRIENNRYMRELDKQNSDESHKHLEEAKTAAEIRSIESGRGTSAASGPMGLEQMISAVEALQKLRINLGEKTGGGFFDGLTVEKVVAMIPLIKMGMEVLGVGGKSKENEMLPLIMSMQAENNKLLIAALTGGGGGRGGEAAGDMIMKGFNTAISMVGGARELLAPPEKEGFWDKALGLLDKVGPLFLEAARKTPAQRAVDPGFQAAMAHPMVKEIQGDPEKHRKMFQMMDEKYGFQNTNELLAGMADIGIVRPKELEGNFALYPSDGYDVKGLKIEGYVAPVAEESAGGENVAGAA